MSSQDSPPIPEAPPQKRSIFGWVVMLALLVGGAAYGVHVYHKSLTREVTDNAQIDANIIAVSARARGQVKEVKVKDNDLVKKGDLLFALDDADYQTKVQQAEAALTTAKTNLSQASLQVALAERSTSAKVGGSLSSITVSEQQVVSAGQAVAVAQAEAARSEAGISQARAAIEQAQAQVTSAQAQLEKAQAEAKRLSDDRSRYRELYVKREVSQQQYEAAATAAAQAESQVQAARGQVSAARAGVESARATLANAQAGRQVALENVGKAQANRGEMEARVGQARSGYDEAQAATLQASVARAAVEGAKAEIQRAQANLKEAKLALSYTKVYAPVSGRVTRKNIEVGQNLEIGVPALALVDETEVWVVANYKETQLEKMSVGQKATLKIDAYPGTPLQGQIESFQAGTGSVFSLLPPENASGSFVKVVQRVPIKITLTAEEQKKVPLRPGMSVEATVWLN